MYPKTIDRSAQRRHSRKRSFTNIKFFTSTKRSSAEILLPFSFTFTKSQVVFTRSSRRLRSTRSVPAIILNHNLRFVLCWSQKYSGSTRMDNGENNQIVHHQDFANIKCRPLRSTATKKLDKEMKWRAHPDGICHMPYITPIRAPFLKETHKGYTFNAHTFKRPCERRTKDNPKLPVNVSHVTMK